jgi:hypothetical protein
MTGAIGLRRMWIRHAGAEFPELCDGPTPKSDAPPRIQSGVMHRELLVSHSEAICGAPIAEAWPSFASLRALR